MVPPAERPLPGPARAGRGGARAPPVRAHASTSIPSWPWRSSWRRCCSTPPTTARRATCGRTGAPWPAWRSGPWRSPSRPSPSWRAGWSPACPGLGGGPGRHRRPARRGGRDGGAPASPAAPPGAGDPRRREPLQRRQRAAHLPARGRRGADRRHSPAGARCRRCCWSRPAASCWRPSCPGSRCYVSARIRDVATAVSCSSSPPSRVWIIAERLHLSGIITVVVFAILVARLAPDLIPARLRIQSYAVWEVAVFVLNVLAFILIGLQLKPILGRLAGAELVAVHRRRGCGVRRRHPGPHRVGHGLRRWSGAGWASGGSKRRGARRRGLVRHARNRDPAAALPGAAGHPLSRPHPFTAFCVVLVTLVVQGMTVTPLMRALALRDDGSVDREVRRRPGRDPAGRPRGGGRRPPRRRDGRLPPAEVRRTASARRARGRQRPRPGAGRLGRVRRRPRHGRSGRSAGC